MKYFEFQETCMMRSGNRIIRKGDCYSLTVKKNGVTTCKTLRVRKIKGSKVTFITDNFEKVVVLIKKIQKSEPCIYCHRIDINSLKKAFYEYEIISFLLDSK